MRLICDNNTVDQRAAAVFQPFSTCRKGSFPGVDGIGSYSSVLVSIFTRTRMVVARLGIGGRVAEIELTNLKSRAEHLTRNCAPKRIQVLLVT